MNDHDSGADGKVGQAWSHLKIADNLAYRFVGDEVFCWRTGANVENRFAIVGGLGVEVFSSVERRAAFDAFRDEILARFDVSPDEFDSGLEEFLVSAVAAGLFTEESPNGATSLSLRSPVSNGGEPEVSEADVLDTMFEKASAQVLPLKVFFELTHHCNHHCQHCYLGFGVGVPGTSALSTSRQLELLDEMAQAGVLELILTGGEPTLHRAFTKILQRAHELHFAVELLTNGTRLDEELVELLASVSLVEVRVPIYGLEAYHNRFVRNARSFKRTWKGIVALHTHGVPVTVTSTLMSDNADQLLEIKRRLDSLGIRFQVSPLVYPTIQRNAAPTQYRATREQFRAMTPQLGITLRRSRCTAGVSRFRIGPDGSLHPCEMLSTIELGNLAHHSFETVLRSPERQEWIARFRSYLETKDRAGCRECRVRSYCVDCVGLSYLESTTFDGRCQEACQLAHAIAYIDQRDQMVAALA